MKIYLSIDEMKTLRDALYSKQRGLSTGLEEHREKPPEKKSERVIEVLEEGIAECDKLLAYFNNIIQADS